MKSLCNKAVQCTQSLRRNVLCCKL